MAVNIDKQLLGGLNSDMNIQNVAPIDYLDALNITAKRRQPEAGEDIYPLLGEEYPFANAPDFSQTQIFIRGRRVRVYLPKKNDPSTYPATPLGIFIFRNSNGTPITPTGPSLSGGVTWATLVTDFNIYLGGLLGVNGMSGTATFVATPNNSEYDGYIEIEVVKIGIYTLEFQALYTGYTLPIQIMSDVITTNFYARGGVNKIVGSCRDARGTYLFFSPKPNANMNKPLSAITAVTNTVDLNLASNTVITFAQPHGLYQFERIYIKDCIDSIHINGTWQVYVITTTQVALISSILSIFVPGVGGGAITEFVYDNVSSIGYVSSSELLNAQKAVALTATDTENNFAANLTVLLRPNTRISFTHDNPIDATAKYNNYNAILKWTDNFNKPKMLVYSGDFAVEDGYLYGGGPTVGGVPIPGTENWAGKYRLESLEVTSNLQIADQNFKLSISQTTGGSLKSSNYIYLVAGVTFDGAQTTFGFPTNPISCVSANTQGVTALESYLYTGNIFDEATNKINILTINNIPTGVYEYLRIVCLRYTPLAFELFQFAEYRLASNQITAVVQHTGNEITIPVSTEEITQTYLSITKALNISELLNTTILSNLTFEADEDLSTVVGGIQYQVRYITALDPFGLVPGTLTNAFPLGEYANPNNQPNYMSFMPFETVRCGIIFKRRGGGWTKVYHIDDIRIDDSPAVGKRIGTLTGITCNQGDIITLSFTNLDWDFVLPSGLKLREVYEDARFVRSSITPQVRMTGMAFLSYKWIDPVTGNSYAYLDTSAGDALSPNVTQTVSIANIVTTFVGPPGRYTITFSSPHFLSDGIPANLSGILGATNANGVFTYSVSAPNDGEYQITSPTVIDIQVPTAAMTYTSGGVLTFPRDRQVLYFMSFDGMNSENFVIPYESGMQLICCGSPSNANPYIPSLSASEILYEYQNWASDSSTFQTLNILAMQPLSDDGTSSVSLDPSFPAMIAQDHQGGYGAFVPGFLNQCPIANRIYGIIVDAPILNATTVSSTDIGMYYCFVYQPLATEYPENPAESKYCDMGFTAVNVNIDNTATSYIILSGGNCYAQNTYMGFKNVADGVFNQVPPLLGWSTSIAFQSYNRNNAQVQKRMFPGGYAGITPPTNIDDCVLGFIPGSSLIINNDSIKASSANYIRYSLAFTKRVLLPELVGYDPNVPEVGTAQATIVWSLPSIENSTWNNDRVFQPLNRRDLELTFGPIWGSFVLNKILVTVQTDYIERQYFDNTGYLIGGSAPAILGTGETMGRKGDSIAMIGSSNKWSLFSGMSNSGNQFLYGVDGKRFKFWRVGQDGTTILTDSFKIDYLSKKNLTLAKFFKNPIDNNGITGVYDVKNEAAIWTSIGVAQPVKINGEYWASGTSYTAGAIVKDEGCDYLFESVPVLFRAKLNHTSTILNRPRINNSFSKTFWEAIPLTNTDYYNVFTIVFYEDRNVFKTFLSYYHSHMAGFEDTFVVMPNNNRFFQSLETQTITITDVDSIVGNVVTLIVSSTALLGAGVGIYITSLPGTTNMLGYYQFTPSILGTGFYGILSPTLISINCYNTPTAPGPISAGTITLTYGTSVAPQSRLYVHRELGQVLRWYPKTYTIPCLPYSYTAGDTKVLIGIQLVSIIPNSEFWENMVLVFDFNKQIREVTKLTEEEIYFDEPLTSSGTLSSLVFEMYLSKDAYVTPVINENRGSLVKFCNFRFNSLEAPYKVEMQTPKHSSYLLDTDFVNYDTIHDAPIKMDTTGGFTPDTGESVLFGKYMKVKITFRKLVEQFIHKFGTGIRLMSSEKKRR